MAASRVKTVQGVLIHAHPVGETGFKGWIFSAEYGLVPALGRGTTPEKCRQADWSLRLSELGNRISDFRYQGPVLAQSAQARYFALYLHELLYRLAPIGVGDDELYRAYCTSLIQLNHPEHLTVALRRFERSLLDALGQSVDFRLDTEQVPISPDGLYRFQPMQGFEPDPDGTCSGRLILAAESLSVDVPGALSLARFCLAAQIDRLLENSPLQTRQWPLKRTESQNR